MIRETTQITYFPYVWRTGPSESDHHPSVFYSFTHLFVKILHWFRKLFVGAVRICSTILSLTDFFPPPTKRKLKTTPSTGLCRCSARSRSHKVPPCRSRFWDSGTSRTEPEDVRSLRLCRRSLVKFGQEDTALLERSGKGLTRLQRDSAPYWVPVDKESDEGVLFLPFLSWQRTLFYFLR